MKTISFCLFKYFPFGGLQRDFVRIAKLCQKNGFQIKVYTMTWSGDVPEGFDVNIIPVKGFTNHSRAAAFSKQILALKKQNPQMVFVGFNKMAGLDFYFGADTCLAESLSNRSKLYQMMPRAKTFLNLEKTIFSNDSTTHLLLISHAQVKEFGKHYGIAEDRFTLLPCGASQKFYDHKPQSQIDNIRNEFGVFDSDILILQVGSDYKRKGVDRAIEALANVKERLVRNFVYVVVGEDNEKSFVKLAKKLSIGGNVIFTGARQDVDLLMQSSDFLVHAARTENTGTTIVEALATDLPVLCTEVCGYSGVVLDCKAGIAVEEPFSIEKLSDAFIEMFDRSERNKYRKNAKVYGTPDKLMGLDSVAAELILQLASKNT